MIRQSEHYWRWRYRMIEKLAARVDPARYGIKGFYVFGSTKNATAGPGSDIDIIIHFDGSEIQKKRLQRKLNCWSRKLAKTNFKLTGYKTDELLDIHFVTDQDIARKSSYAVKIGAVTDAARPLKMKE